MPDSATIDALRKVSLFTGLSDEQFASVEKGKEIRLHPGAPIAEEGEPPKGFYVQLEGRTEWTRRIGAQEVHVLTHDAGVYYGHELLMTGKPHPVTGRALTEVRLYKLEPAAFWAMLSDCPEVLRGLVSTLAERWQNVGEVSQHHARLVSLGTMAAGLAHELNNPAAAIRRGAGDLAEVFQRLPELAVGLSRSCRTPEQLRLLTEIQREAAEYATIAAASAPLDPLAESDREDAIVDWLEKYGVEDGWELAPALAGAGLLPERLDEVAGNFDAGSLGDVLEWLSATLSTAGLLGEVRQSASRISELVQAIKAYSYMDRGSVQEVDVREGLESTLVMLNHKLKKGDIEVVREYAPDLPPVSAHGGELNQVWTNLLDNAIDALGGEGRISIRTASAADDRVLVEIADNGPGIPEEVKDRIFEPFFTTKDIGEGSGLGLDIAWRIVAGTHKGDIRVESRPGDTRFQVRLPVDGQVMP